MMHRNPSTSRRGAVLIVGLAILFGVGAPAEGQTSALIPAVRAAIARQSFADGERLVSDYRSSRGVTPEMLEALSWLGRGALAAKRWDKADEYATQTYDLARTSLKSRTMDQEPRLPTALGAAIEVRAHVSAQVGARSEAVLFLQRELRTYKSTSIAKRIQKNINLLSLEGTHAPALDLSESLAPKPLSLDSLKGKVVVVFFWAHWCPDCKAQSPILANLAEKYERQGLAIIAPTQRYGYVAGGRDATPAEENRYIGQIHATHYGFLPENTVALSEVNHLRYGVSTTPTLVLLDREGVVRRYHPGQMTETELEAAVVELLAPVTRVRP